jgi:hypothetical protein
MVSNASADELLDFETDQTKEGAALRQAALCDADAARATILRFFSHLGLSLHVSPVFSPETETEMSPSVVARSGVS